MVRSQRCAGGIVRDGAGRLLVIRRGREPGRGLWSVPGGRCLPGESVEQACVREVAEETGLTVRVLSEAGRVERDGPAGVRYDIVDFECEVVGGELRPGDDATDVRWVTRVELGELAVVPELVECLTSWGLLPA